MARRDAVRFAAVIVGSERWFPRLVAMLASCEECPAGGYKLSSVWGVVFAKLTLHAHSTLDVLRPYFTAVHIARLAVIRLFPSCKWGCAIAQT